MPTSSVEVNLKFASDVQALQAAITQLQALKTAATDSGAGAQAAGAGFQELQARLSWLGGMVQQMTAVGNAAQALASRGGSLGQAYQSVANAAGQVNAYLVSNGSALVKAAQSANLDAAAVQKLNAQLVQLGRGAAQSLNALGPAASGVLDKLQTQYAEFGKVSTGANAASGSVRNLGFAYGNLAARLGSIGPQLAANATGFRGAGQAINDMTVLARVLASQLRVAPALAIGAATGIGSLIAVIGGLTVAYTGLVVQGVKLNAELQNTQTALASTLSTLASGTYGGQSGALAASAAAMADLQQKANALQVPLKEVLETFNGLNAAATLSGASLDKQNTLYTQLVAAQSRINVSTSQLISDTKNLINGRVSDNNQVALALDLSKQQVLQARENGTIFDLLISKTKSLSDAYAGSSDNFSDANKKMQAALQQLESVAAKPFMQPLIQAIQNVAKGLADPQMQSSIQNFGQWIVDAAEKAVQALQTVLAAVNNIETAMQGFQRVVAGAIDNALVSIRNFGNSLPGQILTPGLGGVAQAGIEDRATQYAQVLAQQEALVSQSAKSAASGMNDLAGSSSKAASALKASPPVQAPPGGYPKGATGHDKTDQQDAQQMAIITAQLTEAQNQYNAALEKAKVDHEAGLTSLQQENAAQAQAATTFIGQLNQIKQSLEEEKAKIQSVASAHTTATLQEQKQLVELDAKIQKVNLDIEKTGLALQQTSFGGQFVAQLQKEFDQLAFTGTKAAEDLQSVWQTAFSSINRGITELISGSKSWGQVMSQVGIGILNSLVQIAAKMLENYVLQQAMQLLGITGQSASITTALATGKAIEAAYTPAAIAASIASYGAAATVGTAAFESAMAVGIGSGGLAEGGIVPGRPSHKDNVMVPMARGEGVIKTSSVQHYGAGLIHAINSRSLPRHGYAEGGIIGSGSAMSGGGQAGGGTSTGRPLHVNVFTSHEELAQHTLNHPEAEHKIVDTVRRNRFQIKI